MMRKALIVGAVLCVCTVLVFGQGMACEGDCKGGITGNTITIPLGAIYGAICALFPAACAPGVIGQLVAGTLIPSIEIQFNTTAIVEDFWVDCPDGCCPEGRLYARPNLMLYGDTVIKGIVPARVALASSIPGPVIEDQSQRDEDPETCGIKKARITFPISDFRLSLVFLDNFTFQVYGRRSELSRGAISATVKVTDCSVSYGCGPGPTVLRSLSWAGMSWHPSARRSGFPSRPMIPTAIRSTSGLSHQENGPRFGMIRGPTAIS